eukprot:scpid34655/ scgid22356/ GPI ethanolamine phosphate transferase 1; MCD4 homolog; Phosphatidylinositol-glycan biosynthesis class N protein
MKLKTNAVLVSLGVFLHVTCLVSIFDMYFRSPIVHGMQQHAMPKDPPAKRLVLFVGDGVRAHSFFENEVGGKSRVPFLNGIMERRGSWGISHTRVPTESRPCHVAIIAGFYEDVSAVTRGWKENPVKFDSVFNQSTHTWSWGSPDILPMFEKGAVKDRVSAFMYPPELEDFGDEDASHLDRWVFDRVIAFLNHDRLSKDDAELLQQPGIVLFLHLLGTDTNGHAHRPASWQYKQNIALVDEGIRNITEHIEAFFQHDGRTAYVFTSDHGMTDWGVHGSGLAHETLTPLVAWGAGVAGPRRHSQSDGESEPANSWGMGDLVSHDVEQADIAPLMSSLLGIHIPANNVGKLPVSYLATSSEYTAKSKLVNAKQLLEQFDVMAATKQANTPEFLFVSFPDLLPSKRSDVFRQIDQLLRQGRSTDAIHLMEDLIELTLKGLRYYQTYDRFFIGGAVALGMMGGMLCIVTEVLATSYSMVPVRPVPTWLKAFVSVVFSATSLLLFMQRAPLQYYVYGSLPLGCIVVLSQRASVWERAVSGVSGLRSLARQLCFLLMVLGGLEILVWSFFWRWSLSVGLVLISGWPWFSPRCRMHWVICTTWTLGCLLLSVFPTLPVVGGEPQIALVNVAVCIVALAYPAATFFLDRALTMERRERMLSCLQYGLFLVAGYVVNAVAQRKRSGLPLAWQQMCSWCLLIVSPCLPILGTRRIGMRLVRIAMAISTVYLLMSISYESLFMVTLCVVVFSWLSLEALERHSAQVCFAYVNQHEIDKGMAKSLSNEAVGGMQSRSHSIRVPASGRSTKNDSTTNAIGWPEVRSAYLLVFFSTVAFFGTGNIASLNSFTVASITTFLTVFSPTLMMMLLISKIAIPLLIVACVFNAVRDVCRAPVREFFALSLVMSDFLALHFFFMVRDSGSWLDIGTSISHFALATIMAGALLVICALAHEFMAVRAVIGSDKSHED